MKIQRKLLTDEQKKTICEKHTKDSDEKSCLDSCPLILNIFGIEWCYKDVDGIEQAIKDYWNEEIEV